MVGLYLSLGERVKVLADAHIDVIWLHIEVDTVLEYGPDAIAWEGVDNDQGPLPVNALAVEYRK